MKGKSLNLNNECSIVVVSEKMDFSNFSCGDDDLDDFFINEACLYDKQMLGKTYAFIKKNDNKAVCLFTLSNDSIKSSLIPSSSRNKIQRKIPNSKRTRSYPAVLIGRLGVSVDFKGYGIGSQTIDYIKYLFTRSANLTGCRFLVVDAYNNDVVLSFYVSNGFKFLYPSEDIERETFDIDFSERLNSRMMYCDLLVNGKK